MFPEAYLTLLRNQQRAATHMATTPVVTVQSVTVAPKEKTPGEQFAQLQAQLSLFIVNANGDSKLGLPEMDTTDVIPVGYAPR